MTEYFMKHYAKKSPKRSTNICPLLIQYFGIILYDCWNLILIRDDYNFTFLQQTESSLVFFRVGENVNFIFFFNHFLY